VTDPIETASRAIKAKIVFERTYRASVRELWDMWTTKEGFESWWAPEGLRAEVRTMEARLGGRYVYDMIGDTPETIAELAKLGLPPSQAVHGRFSEFRPHQSLALTHMMDFVPGVAPYETTMRVEFFPARNGPGCREREWRANSRSWTKGLGDRRWGEVSQRALGTLTKSDRFGIPSTSHWTGAAIIVQ
jgi:uncharacterized protein YndB with AHSA1/START domain